MKEENNINKTSYNNIIDYYVSAKKIIKNDDDRLNFKLSLRKNKINTSIKQNKLRKGVFYDNNYNFNNNINNNIQLNLSMNYNNNSNNNASKDIYDYLNLNYFANIINKKLTNKEFIEFKSTLDENYYNLLDDLCDFFYEPNSSIINCLILLYVKSQNIQDIIEPNEDWNESLTMKLIDIIEEGHCFFEKINNCVVNTNNNNNNNTKDLLINLSIEDRLLCYYLILCILCNIVYVSEYYNNFLAEEQSLIIFNKFFYQLFNNKKFKVPFELLSLSLHFISNVSYDSNLDDNICNVCINVRTDYILDYIVDNYLTNNNAFNNCSKEEQYKCSLVYFFQILKNIKIFFSNIFNKYKGHYLNENKFNKFYFWLLEFASLSIVNYEYLNSSINDLNILNKTYIKDIFELIQDLYYILDIIPNLMNSCIDIPCLFNDENIKNYIIVNLYYIINVLQGKYKSNLTKELCYVVINTYLSIIDNIATYQINVFSYLLNYNNNNNNNICDNNNSFNLNSSLSLFFINENKTFSNDNTTSSIQVNCTFIDILFDILKTNINPLVFNDDICNKILFLFSEFFRSDDYLDSNLLDSKDAIKSYNLIINNKDYMLYLIDYVLEIFNNNNYGTKYMSEFVMFVWFCFVYKAKNYKNYIINKFNVNINNKKSKDILDLIFYYFKSLENNNQSVYYVIVLIFNIINMLNFNELYCNKLLYFVRKLDEYSLISKLEEIKDFGFNQLDLINTNDKKQLLYTNNNAKECLSNKENLNTTIDKILRICSTIISN